MSNNTLRNLPLLSILFELMKKNKCNNPPLDEDDITVQDPKEQGNIFNAFFASKSIVILYCYSYLPFIQRSSYSKPS